MTEIKRIESGSNAYLINCNQHFFMIDSGDGQVADIRKVCQGIGKDVSDLEFIILTHAHCDHVENAFELKNLSGAKIIAHQLAQQKLKAGFAPFPKGTSFLNKTIAFFLDIFSSETGSFKPVEADLLVENTFSLENLGIKGWIHSTPGHTEDSIIVILDNKHCFTGDTMFNHFPWTVYPMFANDEEKLKESWQYIKSLNLVEKFYPGHGEPFTQDEFFRTYKRII